MRWKMHVTFVSIGSEEDEHGWYYTSSIAGYIACNTQGMHIIEQ